jgi:hypothetical protein
MAANNFNFTESGYTPTSYDFQFGAEEIFNVLAGTNNNFVAIWADVNTSLTSGRLYVSSPSNFSVLEMTDRRLVDAYSTTIKGAANEYLQQEDVVDINIQ